MTKLNFREFYGGDSLKEKASVGQKVTYIPSNEPAYVVETSVEKNLYKIKLANNSREFWTLENQIDV